jgi:PTH1 family peptidyl-tRNA hydrolase
MRLLVGLGNPGREYEGTRHNVGFAVLDHLALHEGLLFQSPPSLQRDGLLDRYEGPRAFTLARAFDPEALLVKPQTFMNRSGEVVVPLLRWAGLEPASLMVVSDDLDLPLGTLRLRASGGHGGHNGLRSIVDGLGTNAFPRLRVGIGRPSTDAVRHVLSPFDPAERVEVEISIAEASEACQAWLDHGDIEQCMTRFHSRWSVD